MVHSRDAHRGRNRGVAKFGVRKLKRARTRQSKRERARAREIVRSSSRANALAF